MQHSGFDGVIRGVWLAMVLGVVALGAPAAWAGQPATAVVQEVQFRGGPGGFHGGGFRGGGFGGPGYGGRGFGGPGFGGRGFGGRGFGGRGFGNRGFPGRGYGYGPRYGAYGGYGFRQRRVWCLYHPGACY